MSIHSKSNRYYNIPDVRDGLTELERTILITLYEAKREYGDRMIPAALLYGRVVEKLDVSWEEFQHALKQAMPGSYF